MAAGTAAGRERTLTSLRPGASARVCRVASSAEHGSRDLLRFLGDHGIHPGAEIAVTEVSAPARTLTVRVGAREVAMAADVAAKVWVGR